VPESPQTVRLLLDAIDEFARIVDGVPDPGRGRPLGRLNTPGWTIVHAVGALDGWINGLCAGGESDEWMRSRDPESLPAFAEAREAIDRVRERATPYLESCDDAELGRTVVEEPAWWGSKVEHLVTRAVGHLFAHAGDMSVTASLVGSGDLGLPGPLPRSAKGGDEALEPGERPPLMVLLNLDGRHEFMRTARVMPRPAWGPLFERLNAAGWPVAHIAEQDDQYWNVHARGRDGDAWLALQQVAYGGPRSVPDFEQALAALVRTFESTTPFVGSLDGSTFDDVTRKSRIPERGDQTVAELLARQTAHLFALAGELGSISSLLGGGDPGLPGRMLHCQLGELVGAAS
jgi:hypothetical protein